MKKIKVTYYLSTGLLSAMMLMSVGMYFLKHSEIAQAFTSLGYPPYLVYPLGVAKLLGLVAIVVGISKFLRNLAYAGFFYTFMLAASAHFMAGDGRSLPPIIALALLGASFWSRTKLDAIHTVVEEHSSLKLAIHEG